MKLVENLAAFAGETSIHGLIYIAKSPSKAKRIAWFFLFSASLAYALTQISYEAKCKLIHKQFMASPMLSNSRLTQKFEFYTFKHYTYQFSIKTLISWKMGTHFRCHITVKLSSKFFSMTFQSAGW